MGLSVVKKSSTCGCTVAQSTPAAPNPDPSNFRILKSLYFGDLVALWVHYPDCTTFEGRKIMVYQGVQLQSLETSPLLDPHFCDSSEHPIPIARFAGDSTGWKNAKWFVENFPTVKVGRHTTGLRRRG